MAAHHPLQLGSYALRSVVEAQQPQSQTDRFRQAYLTQSAHGTITQSVIPNSLKISFKGWDEDITWNSVRFCDLETRLGGDGQKVVFDSTSIQPYNGIGSGTLRPLLQEATHIGFYRSRVEPDGLMSNWFHNCQTLQNIDMFMFDTSRARNMSCLFSGCWALTDLDISTWDTSNVVDMSSMFNECKALPSLNLSSFNTRRVTSMDNMFCDCEHLTELDLSNFELDSLTSAWWMFKGCGRLSTVILKGAALKKLASLEYKPPIVMSGIDSVVDNQTYVLSGAVAKGDDVNAFIVGAPQVMIHHHPNWDAIVIENPENQGGK